MKNDNDVINQLQGINFEYTAIFGYSSLPVVKAYDTLRNMGLQVPDQVSFMGYGDFYFCEILNVPLTVVSIPVYDIGYQAVCKIISALKNNSSTSSEVLDVKIIERNSVLDISHI